MRLVDVTKADYQHFLNEFGKTRTKVTVSKYNSFFRSMCEDAIAEQLIYTDFTRNTTIVAGKESKSPDEKFLEPDDYIKLIEVAKMHTSINDISSAEVYLVTQTGMRYEECAGLTWNDINFNKKVIRVNKAIENDTRNQKLPKHLLVLGMLMLVVTALMYLKSSKLVRKNTSIELITLILTIMFLEADVKKLLLLNQSISN
jgi:Site-specific recombinase XerD